MRKYGMISDLAEAKTKDVERNGESWRKYLNTASGIYKYPFKDQLLIYAQRPDATACASIEIWNEKMHCWVNKGAKGISLIDDDTNTGLKSLAKLIVVSEMNGVELDELVHRILKKGIAEQGFYA